MGGHHRSRTELDAGLSHIAHAPKDGGTLVMIVRRPAVDERERLPEAQLDTEEGLVGDSWKARGRRGGPADPNQQLTLMSSRVIALVAGDEDRWPLAGDQLYVDLDLSDENLPAGSRLEIGSAIIELTAEPHTGCAKFVGRYGRDAMMFVNAGKALRLRGANARVIVPGTVRTGDVIRKVAHPPGAP